MFLKFIFIINDMLKFKLKNKYVYISHMKIFDKKKNLDI